MKITSTVGALIYATLAALAHGYTPTPDHPDRPNPLTPTPVIPTPVTPLPSPVMPTPPDGYTGCNYYSKQVSLKPVGVTPVLPQPSPTPVTVTPAPITPVVAPVPAAAPTPASAWQAEQVYTAGQTVTYQGGEYRARWWTQGERPQAGGWGAWELVATSAAVPEWVPEQTFVAGQQASYDGKVYRARWWTQGEVPGPQSGAWEYLRLDSRVSLAQVDFQGRLTVMRCRNYGITSPYNVAFFEAGVYQIDKVTDPLQVVTALKTTSEAGSVITTRPWRNEPGQEVVYTYQGIQTDEVNRPPLNVVGGRQIPWLCTADDVCRYIGQ
ncbi:carbohydrate-binding protein [Chitiniphilus purpureus]|uniref:Carbohydrate-binding protein n=1 Tax=Chitiniphilus purpureus TaxID=2981137 RepID=A0ABY6DLS0_9NEIS|nr:carbohydrate-binding protein [Chitiniphilus sp. CD1]UXY15153.1 carbohydrate-binding protein [Chitiniphilus sp. CD1]